MTMPAVYRARPAEAPEHSRMRPKHALLYLLVFLIVLVRWFTETTRLLPRFFNFADLPLFGLAVLIVILRPGGITRVTFCRARLFPLVLAFIAWSLLSTALNLFLYGIPTIPALASITFYIEPIAFAVLFVTLGWDRADTARLTRLFLVLGLLQIPTALVQMPSAIRLDNPDLISGTFGFDNSQMCFFILLLVAYLIARYAIEGRKVYLLPVPALLVLFYAAGFKALWYALIPTLIFVVAIVFPAKLGRKLLICGVVLVIIFEIALPLGSSGSRGTTSFLTRRYASAVFASGTFWRLGKIQAFLNLPLLYERAPLSALLGVGPGAYADRAFFTFTQTSPNVSAQANVTRGFVDPIMPSRFASELTVPLIYKHNYLFGSWTIDGPVTSYVALLGEIGIVGFVLYLFIYFSVFKLAWNTARRAWRDRDPLMFGISIACVVGVLILCEMSFLDNWLQVSRVTVPLWLLFVPIFHAASRQTPGPAFQGRASRGVRRFARSLQ